MTIGTAAVVVTYNRLELLKRCLDAIATQSAPIDTIIVINNHSTDGTDDFLNAWKNSDGSPRKMAIHMASNTGGAGGFSHGVKQAIDAKHAWIWLMDDDVIPEKDALKELLKAAEVTSKAKGFYSSVATDESMRFTVSVPAIDTSPAFQGYSNWGEFLASSIVKIQTSTFVSLLVSREAILKVGLPIKEFFIWGDDTEYTRRMSSNGIQGYWVGNSRVIHLRPGTHGINLKKEADSSRIHLYEYLYRNWTYISRATGDPTAAAHIRKSLIDAASLLIRYRSPQKCATVLKGIMRGIFFKPKIEMISDDSAQP